MSNRNDKSRAETPAARMRTLYAAGDTNAARQVAWEILHDPAASDADKDAARHLREQTEVDRRGYGIALFAVAIAAAVIVFFLMR